MPHAAKEITFVRKRGLGPSNNLGKKRFSVHTTPNPTPATDSTEKEAKGIPGGTKLSRQKFQNQARYFVIEPHSIVP